MAQAKMSSGFESAKGWFRKQRESFSEQTTMEALLRRARESFEYFLSDGNMIQIEKKISDKLWRDAYGIVFLSEVKAGFGIGGKAGTGIIIARVESENEEEKDSWGPPAAVGTGGLTAGFQIGASKVDHIVILPSPNHIKAFLGKGQFKLGAGAEAVMVNTGRDANVGVGVNNKGSAAPIMSYSFGVKGIYAGITLDGTVLVPRKDCNSMFYGDNVTLEQIISGQVDIPDNEDYKSIVKLLEVNSRITGQEKGHKMDPDDLTPLSSQSQEIPNDQQNEKVEDEVDPDTKDEDDPMEKAKDNDEQQTVSLDSQDTPEGAPGNQVDNELPQ